MNNYQTYFNDNLEFLPKASKVLGGVYDTKFSNEIVNQGIVEVLRKMKDNNSYKKAVIEGVMHLPELQSVKIINLVSS